jgi:hypothetical protein
VTRREILEQQTMTQLSNRRQFFRDAATFGAAATAAGLAFTSSQVLAADPARTTASAEPFVMGIIGTGGRGQAVAANFAATPGVVIKNSADGDDGML